MTLAAHVNQEMNGQVEVTWRTLHTVAHSLMVHVRVPEVYVHFSLMYTTYHICTVLTIKDLIHFDALESQRRYHETLFALGDSCLTSLSQRAP